MMKKLLLADDSITIQKVVGIIFATEDFELTMTGDGDSAFEKALEQVPDLVIADISMPGKDGFELCREIKKDPSLGKTSVLLLPGAFDHFDEAKAEEVCADGWLTKPFESQALLDKVNQLIEAEPLRLVAAAVPEEIAVAPVELEVADEAGEDVFTETVDSDAAVDDVVLGLDNVDDLPPANAPADAFDDSATDDIWDAVSFEEDDLGGEDLEAQADEDEAFMAAGFAEDEAVQEDEDLLAVVQEVKEAPVVEEVEDQPSVAESVELGIEDIADEDVADEPLTAEESVNDFAPVEDFSAAKEEVVFSSSFDADQPLTSAEESVDEEPLELMDEISADANEETEDVDFSFSGEDVEEDLVGEVESATSFAEEEVTLAEEEVTLAEEEVTLAEDEVTLAEDEVTLAEDEVTLAEDEVTLAEDEVALVEDEEQAEELLELGEVADDVVDLDVEEGEDVLDLLEEDVLEEIEEEPADLQEPVLAVEEAVEEIAAEEPVVVAEEPGETDELLEEVEEDADDLEETDFGVDEPVAEEPVVVTEDLSGAEEVLEETEVDSAELQEAELPADEPVVEELDEGPNDEAVDVVEELDETEDEDFVFDDEPEELVAEEVVAEEVADTIESSESLEEIVISDEAAESDDDFYFDSEEDGSALEAGGVAGIAAGVAAASAFAAKEPIAEDKTIEEPIAEEPAAEEPVVSAVEQVETQLKQLSDDELKEVVARVAGPIVEKMAEEMLAQVAWEVVPDLAEAMIKEEIRKIKQAVSQ